MTEVARRALFQNGKALTLQKTSRVPALWRFVCAKSATTPLELLPDLQ